ncbi:Response regulator MprA [Rubripirellula tenax]|uniref:Response regulator MprA n=1 Tax=Rubripirellula tenax TaxID=2528015 RepID=A0A5C6FG65_9BACT|nr:response regulator [Rubripirellula tenax]TWU60776.1 Response regulator MprA [Rubripirellula tenax]
MLIPNLLVTDDDAAFRHVVCEGLVRRGFQVTEATDGEEALEVLGAGEVHVCLIDFHMPRLSGLEVIRQLRSSGSRLPCVLMSADLSDDIRREAEAMLAYEILDKPVRLKQLSDVVCGALAEVYGWRPS